MGARTVRCATGQCPVRRHVTLLLGLGAGRPLEALSSCGTGQSGATPTFCSDFCRVIVQHCSSVRVDRCAQIAVTPLVHQTVRWYTRKSGGTPKSPVNYSGAVPGKPEAEEFGVYGPWCTGHCSVVHRTLFGGAPDSPVCQTKEHFDFFFAPVF
jgi:hypothetical protein